MSCRVARRWENTFVRVGSWGQKGTVPVVSSFVHDLSPWSLTKVPMPVSMHQLPHLPQFVWLFLWRLHFQGRGPWRRTTSAWRSSTRRWGNRWRSSHRTTWRPPAACGSSVGLCTGPGPHRDAGSGSFETPLWALGSQRRVGLPTSFVTSSGGWQQWSTGTTSSRRGPTRAWTTSTPC